MRITKFEAENFKRLRAVTIAPDGSLIQIRGKNGQGKSSTLDAIEAALGGAKSIPDEPIRHGEENSRIVLEIDDMTITRTFTEKGSRLAVQWHGAKMSNPQTVLDGLMGRIGFDPVQFMQQDPSAQRATLREMVGLDTAELDRERAELYAERRDLNVEARPIQARIESAEKDLGDDAPAEPVDVSDLLEQIDHAAAMDQERAAARNASALADTSVTNLEREIEDLEARKTELEARLVEQRAAADQLRSDYESMPEPVDVAPLRARVEQASEINQRVQQLKALESDRAALQYIRDQADERTAKMAQIDEQKREMAARAEYPIDGLAIDDDQGVTFNGVPLSQASSAEQLRVSAAIGMALNPKLRVLLIREGSLLDADSMAALASFAEENDAQVWVEVVANGPDGSGVYIEDGEVIQ